MLVTRNFVFLHVPKTGGSFVQGVIAPHLSVVDYKALLRRHDPDQRIWTHAPWSGLPPEWRRLPVFCVVRNPWDWYVSWFSYQSERGPRRRRPPREDAAEWERPFRRGEADFKEVVTRLCIGDFDHPLAPLMREEGIDLYSAAVRSIVGEAITRPNFTALRYEHLRRDLLRYLRRHVEVPGSLRVAVRRAPPRKASDHGPYPGYYDAELAALVGERTRWLCERFGYRFEHPVRPDSDDAVGRVTA